MRAYRGYEQVRTIVPFSMARAGASFAGCGRAQRAGAHTSPGLMRRTQGVPRIERYPHFLGSNGNSLVLGVLRRAIRHFRLWNGGVTVGLEADWAGPRGSGRRQAGRPGTFPVGAGSDRWSARCWFRSARGWRVSFGERNRRRRRGSGGRRRRVGRGQGAHARGSTGGSFYG